MRQIVTEDDFLFAMIDYIVEQADTNLRYLFPNCLEEVDAFVDYFKEVTSRAGTSGELVEAAIKSMVIMLGSSLTNCMLKDCPQTERHDLLQEFLTLIWSARNGTTIWLGERGIVPGFSLN